MGYGVEASNMISARITPRVVAIGLAVHLLMWLVLRQAALTEGDGGARLALAVERVIALMVAYGVACAINLEIANEYRSSSWLRFAWLAFAANAAISLFRPVVESQILYSIAPADWDQAEMGLLQHLLIIPANCCFLLGVLSMWFAYHRVGLGFRIERRDYLAMAGVLILTIGLMTYRENLTEAQSPYLTSRILQPVGLILLSVCSAASIVLYRLAMQMGGGQLALALRWLTVYVLLRGVLVLLRALSLDFLPEGGTWLGRYVIEVGWQIVPWIVALAAVCRAELTVKAARELEQRRAAKSELVSV